jgi:Ca-activated chloride channel family protein
MTRGLSTIAALLAASASLTATGWATAPQVQDEEEADLSSIVVTGSLRVRQGGAQDITHFRNIAEDVGMPRPESLTVEGLMGEHDLTLPSASGCAQLFCLVSEAMPAGLATRPDDTLFVGLGFASNVDAEGWKREPLNLVAVVDKSGSMSGPPLALVRASLKQIVGQMGGRDRIAIVLYGDRSHVHLTPTGVAANRDAVIAAIDAIESAGSTNMEAGLQVGYATAFAEAPEFKGNTRLMLFTDEQPNVGRTDAASFIGMAQEASRRGIGLTTIGVGVQFDGALATKVSSTRGGNLFFIDSPETVKATFEKQLDTMVSEVAHDVKMTLKPVAGYKISGIFGVPAETMTETPDGAIDITVPTAFFSTQGGGVFLTLARAGGREHLPAARLSPEAALLDVALSYSEARSGKPGSDRVRVAQAVAAPSVPLRKAQLLVDEYLTLKGASLAFHRNGDPKAAFRLLKDFEARLDGAGLDGMKGEQKLVANMLEQAAFYSGYSGERPKTLRHLTAVGDWEIVGIDGFSDLKRGDRLSFNDDREMLTYRKSQGLDDWDESEEYEINERQIHLTDSNLVFDYRARGDQMTLTLAEAGSSAYIALRRLQK